MMLNTELSIVRKFPCSVVLLKISAQNRGLGVFSESQHGMRNATGRLPGDLRHQIDAPVVRRLRLRKIAARQQRARMVERVHLEAHALP